MIGLGSYDQGSMDRLYIESRGIQYDRMILESSDVESYGFEIVRRIVSRHVALESYDGHMIVQLSSA